jgi:hypothetical protein
MKYFRCDSYSAMVFFQNDRRGKCGQPLGFAGSLSVCDSTGDQQETVVHSPREPPDQPD